ncbi:MAG: GAF domain-containing protein [Leptolyngbyaceae cyanobacterium SM2_3_12]|nr:GAF domain-containing protein [Leptolyngbyaceae cyanobacterium SM2_3_12]
MERLEFKQNPTEIFEQLLPLLGEQLKCDRVFLYLRSPRYHLGRVSFCWRKNENIPLINDPDWKAESSSLASRDPLFAAALKGRPSVFVKDVETASPAVVNRDFERQTFGHRALIHAHLCQGPRLWGILQPCVFDHPRPWRWTDRLLMKRTVSQITPLAVVYVNSTLHDAIKAGHHDC